MTKAIAIPMTPFLPLQMAMESISNSACALAHAMYGTKQRTDRTLAIALLLTGLGAFLQSPMAGLTQCMI